MILGMDEKQLRRRQELIARQREVAVERVADLEYQLDAIAGQLDQFHRRDERLICLRGPVTI